MRARRQEVELAAKIAGLAPPALKSLSVPVRRVASCATHPRDPRLHCRRRSCADHDAIAFAVAAARACMRGKAPIVLEMPLYRKNGAGRTRRHCDGAEQGVCLRLNDEERAQGQDDRRLRHATADVGRIRGER